MVGALEHRVPASALSDAMREAGLAPAALA
jgi:hypothetical protein